MRISLTTSPVRRAWLDILRNQTPPGRDLDFTCAPYHSIGLLILCIEREYGVRFSRQEVIDNNNVDELERTLHVRISKDDRIGSRRREFAMPSFNQRQRLLRDQQDALRHGYRTPQHVSITYATSGALSTAHLREALQEICGRHEILRSAFVSHDLAVINPAVQVEIREIDLSPSATPTAPAVDDILYDACMKPFTLDTGPCWRATLVRISPDSAFLSFAFDHLLMDWWSIAVFENELQAAYREALTGTRTHTMSRQPSYYDWSDSQWNLEKDGTLARILDEWREALDPDRPLPELPKSGLSNPHGCATGETARTIPSRAVMPGLRRAVETARATPFCCVLAAYAKSLVRHFRAADGILNGVVVPVANRSFPDSFDIIGWLANMSIVQLGRIDRLPYIELARRTQSEMHSVIRRSALPFSVLAEEFEPGRLSRGSGRPWAYFDMLDARSSSGFELHGTSVRRVEPAANADRVLGFYLTAVIDISGDLSLHARYQLPDTPETLADDVLETIEHFLTSTTEGPA